MVGLIYQEEGRNCDYLEEIARKDRGFRSPRDSRTGLEILLRLKDSSQYNGAFASGGGPRWSPVSGWGGEGRRGAELGLEKKRRAKMEVFRTGSRI